MDLQRKTNRSWSFVLLKKFFLVYGLFFIPGSQQQNQQQNQQQQEINAYVVPGNFNKIQYAFRPTTGYFLRPHIIRVYKNQVFIGEIAETGGILWHLEIQTESQKNKKIKQLTMNSVFYNKLHDNFAKSSSSLFSSKMNVDIDLINTFLLILFIAFIAYVFYYLIQKFCCAVRKKKSPQDVIDRKVNSKLINIKK